MVFLIRILFPLSLVSFIIRFTLGVGHSEMTCPNPSKFFPANTSLALREGAMKNKVALITGGGTGIGKAIATTFAALGAKVAIAARRTDILEKTAAEIGKGTGGICKPFKMDLKDPLLVAAAIDEIEKKFGQTPNVLVNNAAGNFIMATERLTDNAIGTVVDIALKGTMRVTKEVGLRCINNGSGCAVLSITTTYARAGAPFVVPSAISKSGVETMTKSLATEWAKYGLRFNAIAPGPFPTQGAMGRLSDMTFEEAVKAATATIPLGRCGALEELGNLSPFICSDYGNFINGAIIDIDGAQQHFNHGSSFSPALHEMTSDDWAAIEDKIRGRTSKTKIKI